MLIALCRPYKGRPNFATPATNPQIAEELFLSVAAVKSHWRSLTRAFGIDDLPQQEKRQRWSRWRCSSASCAKRTSNRSAATWITGSSSMSVPVSDVDRAKAFYVDQAGFNADHDHQVPTSCASCS